jgi:hypothetical protein
MIPVKFQGEVMYLKQNPLHGPKKFLFARRFLRFSTIFWYFGWKHELYRIFHVDHENRVFFMVT